VLDLPVTSQLTEIKMMNVAPATLNIASKSVRGVVVTCKCGVIKSMPFNSVHHSRPQAWIESTIARKLEAEGWKTLKAKDGPVCPSCVNSYRRIDPIIKAAVEPEPYKHTTKPSALKDLKDLVTILPKPPEPPELTKENRRVILAKLEDVYVDEQTGYSAGWTDAKVASDLGVPRAWVTSLRSENFGPEGNEEIKVALAEAKELMAAINKAMCAFAEQNRIIDELERRAEKIERTIIEIEKGLRA
jgi:hypothetical protein